MLVFLDVRNCKLYQKSDCKTKLYIILYATLHENYIVITHYFLKIKSNINIFFGSHQIILNFYHVYNDNVSTTKQKPFIISFIR